MLKSYTKTLILISTLLVLSGCAGISTTTTARLPSVPPQITDDYKSGVSAFTKKDYKKAITIFNSIIDKYPESTLSHTNLGLIYLIQNKHELAEKHFQTSLKLTPANPIAHNHMGIIYRNKGEFEKALISYKLAIKYKPDYANAHLNIAILYDIYLHNIALALQHYHRYQSLTKNTDKLVAKWIVDNERRLTALNGESQ